MDYQTQYQEYKALADAALNTYLRTRPCPIIVCWKRCTIA